MASIRRSQHIAAQADDVWALVGDAGRLAEWFPGLSDVTVEGTIRTVTLGSGIPLTEEIVTCDPISRRFAYSITGGLLRHHRGTIDVFDLGDGTTLVSYATDAEPDVMALVIGGAAGAGLRNVKALLEHDSTSGATQLIEGNT
ncbi:MAG: SRPBCC family protein [Actinobacteria bacterium]|nr:SRPBCC family protein [Actinomycetota bacterium]